MTKQMKRSAILFASLFILVLLNACAHAPTPPKGELCGLNGPSGYVLCFDFEKDFGSDGKLKPDAKGTKTTVNPASLKGWYMDPPSKESLEAYAMKWRQRYIDLQNSCK